MEKQKWINEGGIFFPIPGYATIYATPGNGVFQIYEDPMNHRLGLAKIDDAFVFDFKLYDLGCEDIFEKVTTTWFSNIFSSGNKNLGVIFNGIKGTGKTIAAKVLSNRIGLPVVVISEPKDGLLEFIQSLCFECVILIDEAEKTFDSNREMLLKMIDGVYNSSRKLYLLTTNRLTVDENLLGRPGRIRYIKQFGNLTPTAIEEFLDDNLEDKNKRQGILELIDMLTISTIDILKAIVDEVNIHGEVPDDKMLNVPKAEFHFDIVKFNGLEKDRFNELKEYVASRIGKKELLSGWLRKEQVVKTDDKEETKSNEDILEEMFNCWVGRETVHSGHSYLLADMPLRNGIITEDPDELGFFVIQNDWNHTDELCCLVGDHGTPSLYRGKLAF